MSYALHFSWLIDYILKHRHQYAIQTQETWRGFYIGVEAANGKQTVIGCACEGFEIRKRQLNDIITELDKRLADD